MTTHHILNPFINGPTLDVNVLCGLARLGTDIAWHGPTLDDLEPAPADVCSDCDGIRAQLAALTEPVDYMADDTLAGYLAMTERLRTAVTRHGVRTPDELRELARQYRHDHENAAAPYDRGARTACERVMYPGTFGVVPRTRFRSHA